MAESKREEVVVINLPGYTQGQLSSEVLSFFASGALQEYSIHEYPNGIKIKINQLTETKEGTLGSILSGSNKSNEDSDSSDDEEESKIKNATLAPTSQEVTVQIVQKNGGYKVSYFTDQYPNSPIFEEFVDSPDQIGSILKADAALALEVNKTNVLFAYDESIDTLPNRYGQIPINNVQRRVQQFCALYLFMDTSSDPAKFILTVTDGSPTRKKGFFPEYRLVSGTLEEILEWSKDNISKDFAKENFPKNAYPFKDSGELIDEVPNYILINTLQRAIQLEIMNNAQQICPERFSLDKSKLRNKVKSSKKTTLLEEQIISSYIDRKISLEKDVLNTAKNLHDDQDLKEQTPQEILNRLAAMEKEVVKKYIGIMGEKFLDANLTKQQKENAYENMFNNVFDHLGLTTYDESLRKSILVDQDTLNQFNSLKSRLEERQQEVKLDIKSTFVESKAEEKLEQKAIDPQSKNTNPSSLRDSLSSQQAASKSHQQNLSAPVQNDKVNARIETCEIAPRLGIKALMLVVNEERYEMPNIQSGILQQLRLQENVSINCELSFVSDDRSDISLKIKGGVNLGTFDAKSRADLFAEVNKSLLQRDNRQQKNNQQQINPLR